jgi:hypothetical protein
MYGMSQVGGPAERGFWFSYLMVFMFWTAISVGALGFVMIHYLVRAKWSVVVRRIAENLSLNFLWILVFSLPIFFGGGMDHLYDHWMHSEHHVDEVQKFFEKAVEDPSGKKSPEIATYLAKAKHQYSTERLRKDKAMDYLQKAKIAGWEDPAKYHIDHGGDGHAEDANAIPQQHGLMALVNETDTILLKKYPYLKRNRFRAMGLLYICLWILFAGFFAYNSSKQDKDGKLSRTRWMNRLSPVTVLLTMLTLSFAAFDWMMSIESHWFSTMYGVYFFAGSLLSAFASIYIIVYIFRKLGMLRNTITVEHDHDLGKWMFGFTIFWTYVAFSQFMLIGYANMPEETFWFQHRWTGIGWQSVSLSLLFFKFLFPFLALLSRWVKRNPHSLLFMALWVLMMHLVDIYWLVMPMAGGHGHIAFHPQWSDLICLVSMSSVFIGFFLFNTGRKALVPVKDPWFDDSLNFENF